MRKLVTPPGPAQIDRQHHVNRETLAERLLLRVDPVIGVKAHPLEQDLVGDWRIVARNFACHCGASIQLRRPTMSSAALTDNQPQRLSSARCPGVRLSMTETLAVHEQTPIANPSRNDWIRRT